MSSNIHYSQFGADNYQFYNCPECLFKREGISVTKFYHLIKLLHLLHLASPACQLG